MLQMCQITQKICVVFQTHTDPKATLQTARGREALKVCDVIFEGGPEQRDKHDDGEEGVIFA